MPDLLHHIWMPEALGATVERYAMQAEQESSAYLSIYEEGEQIMANDDGTFAWNELRYSRDMAPIAALDSPSTGKTKLISKKKTGSVFVIQEHVDLPARFLNGWKNPGSPMPNAAAVVARELGELTGKVLRTKNYWAAKSMLTASGVVDLSAFPNSQVAAGSFTYPVQSISAANSWALASTKLRSKEINPLKKTYRQAAGTRARRVLASSTVEGYITGNTEVSNFINGDGGLAGRILGNSFEERGVGDVVNFGNLEWAFVEDYYALDSAADTPVDVNADNDIFCVLPGRDMSYDAFGLVEGTNYVPTGVTHGEVVGAPDNLVRAIRGMGAYAEVTKAPVGIRLHVFWVGAFVQKLVNAVGVYNTTP